MVIMAVLALLLIGTVVTGYMGDAWSTSMQWHKATVHREQNYQLARSAFEVALQLVLVDDNKVDGFTDPWAKGEQILPWENTQVKLKVTDLERRLPLNTLLPLPSANETPLIEVIPDISAQNPLGDDAQQAMQRVWIRFLENQRMDGERAIAALLDWVDVDDFPRTGGAEQGEYYKVSVPNSPLFSVKDLRHIKGWSPPTLPIPLAEGEAVSLAESSESSRGQGGQKKEENWQEWDHWASAWSSGKVNLNTCPREILKVLDESMTDSIVEEIDKKRREKPLEKEDDLREISGVDADMAFRLLRVADFKSQYFKIEVTVINPPGNIELDAIVERAGSAPRIVWWSLNSPQPNFARKAEK